MVGQGGRREVGMARGALRDGVKVGWSWKRKSEEILGFVLSGSGGQTSVGKTRRRRIISILRFKY